MESEHRRRRHRGEGPRERDRHGRKERVLHTRISEQLADDIRTIAEDLRVPVSNLVRNVLEEAFSAIESVSDNVGDLIEDVMEEAERARDRIHHRRRSERARSGPRSDPAPAEARPRREFPDVAGWQPLILNQPRRCSDCEAELAPGDQAYLGLAEGGASPHCLCRACMAARR